MGIITYVPGQQPQEAVSVSIEPVFAHNTKFDNLRVCLMPMSCPGIATAFIVLKHCIEAFAVLLCCSGRA